MPRDTGRSDAHGEDVTRARLDPESDPSSRRLSRRQALATVGTLSLGATAGCLDAVPLFGGSRVAVEPEAPGEQPEGTPGEFYHLLEKNDVVVDELYHDKEDDDLILFYESNAEEAAESDDRKALEAASDEEIALIYRVFSEGLIDRGSDVNNLFTEVTNRFDGQVKGWGVKTTWAKKHLDGEYTDLQLWNMIYKTKEYGDDGPPEDGANESDAGATGTNDSGDGDDATDDDRNASDDGSDDDGSDA
ncbi:hypothetical protein ACFQGT_03670 [Natrialbaceae archaeon GCM10025810]|uniref:hypothetical protein n=1 Tax=Halovalidus salilacus TaxID=3075124 RepID=UPI0036115A94